MKNRLISRCVAILSVFCLAFCIEGCGEDIEKNPFNNNSSSAGSASSQNSNGTDKGGRDRTVSDTQSPGNTSSDNNMIYDESIVEETELVEQKVYTHTYKNKWGVNDMLKTYTNVSDKLTVETILPSVGYMEQGKIKGTMFDSFVYLPSPVVEPDIASSQKNVKKYVDTVIYKDGYNIYSLEAATELVKNAIGDPNYQVKVFLPLFNPPDTNANFGEYDGNTIDCTTEAGRLEALKWGVDYHIKQFKAQNFKNIKIVGFYWFEEFITVNKDKQLLVNLNAYIHSLGYASVISPFFNASGYSQWDDCGFDLATMQSNYFPGSPGSPNSGGYDRLISNASLTQINNMGMELEMAGWNVRAGVRGFKETMQVGLTMGQINNLHMYYLDGGPSVVYSLYNHKDKYFQSVYHELYRYIKGTLKDEDIMY